MSKKQREFHKFVWITYEEYMTGGELAEGYDAEDAWPEFEDTCANWRLLDVMLHTPREQTYNKLVPCGMIIDGAWIERHPVIGETAYVVVVMHSSGDTFGTTTGKGHPICVCFDLESVTFIEKQIWAGECPEMISYIPGNGYFESIECVLAEERVVQF